MPESLRALVSSSRAVTPVARDNGAANAGTKKRVARARDLEMQTMLNVELQTK